MSTGGVNTMPRHRISSLRQSRNVFGEHDKFQPQETLRRQKDNQTYREE